MGVKHLWNILSPICDRKPLYELEGKTIAIDLSCWIVDSQTVTDNHVQPKMYLRNLFFRTAFLLMNGITPVFVLEGQAPALKHKTIARRNFVRLGKESKRTGRSQFKRILNQCEEMLGYMGVKCLQGYGEAEATCAWLNGNGIVDGCVSQDSDCFLYGGRKVYRNFSIGLHAAGGTVDEYDMERIEGSLKLGRNKMIVMALLCGCDYDPGVNGVGKEAAMKLFAGVEDDMILQRITSWKDDPNYDELEKKLSNPEICTGCGHPGKLLKHAKSGCADCGTLKKCQDSYKTERSLALNEISIRKKCLSLANFPNLELIDEYLNLGYDFPRKLKFDWEQPELDKFVEFMEKHLTWEPDYCLEKLFPLVTRWQLLKGRNLFAPERICKRRNIKGVAQFEILWENQLITVEPENLLDKRHRDLLEEFVATKKKKEPKRIKRKPLRDLNNRKMDEFLMKDSLEKSFECMSISPKRCRVKAGDLSELGVEDFSSDVEDKEMSMVIDKICGTKREEEEEEEEYVPIDVRIERRRMN